METSQRILAAMGELMRRQGYAATGVKQLAQTAGTPTGSIYHHFPGGKREIAAAALRRSGAAYVELLPMLLDGEADLPRAVEQAFATAAHVIEDSGWINMCPVGTVLGEVADVEPGLRETGAEILADWVEQGTAHLAARGLGRADARAATYALLAALEGAFVLSRTQRSTEPLLAAGRSLGAWLATLETGAAVR